MEKRSLSLKLPTKMKKLRILSLILYVDVSDLHYITYIKVRKREYTNQASLLFFSNSNSTNKFTFVMRVTQISKSLVLEV